MIAEMVEHFAVQKAVHLQKSGLQIYLGKFAMTQENCGLTV